MPLENSKEVMLINSLTTILAEKDLKQQQASLLRLSEQLGVSVLECAAALLYHEKIELSFEKQDHKSLVKEIIKADLSMVVAKKKQVRYRLEVGRKHQVLSEEIKNVLVSVSGVERNQIGKMDIRNHYTLVDLPFGMSADIFQLLSETEMNDQKLNIKRIKQHRRYNHQQKKTKKRYSGS